MSEVVYRCAVRQDVSDREESWYVTSTYSDQEDFSSCKTVKDVAQEMADSIIRFISTPHSPMEKESIMGVVADFGKGYARAEVKYISKLNHQVSSLSAMVLVDDALPVIEQSEIVPTAARLVNGVN